MINIRKYHIHYISQRWTESLFPARPREVPWSPVLGPRPRRKLRGQGLDQNFTLIMWVFGGIYLSKWWFYSDLMGYEWDVPIHSYISCGYSKVINHPFLMVYPCIYHPFMVIEGMGYDIAIPTLQNAKKILDFVKVERKKHDLTLPQNKHRISWIPPEHVPQLRPGLLPRPRRRWKVKTQSVDSFGLDFRIGVYCLPTF